MEYYERTVLRTHLSNKNIDHDLRRLISNLSKSAQYIAFEIKKSLRGDTENQNTYGEIQLKLDVLADTIIKKRLSLETSFGVKDFASEEQENIINIHPDKEEMSKKYSIAVDPLDGSSLIKSNLTIGTIFGIYSGSIISGKPGRDNLVAAMYVMYGPETTLVYSAGKGVHEFIFDPAGNWTLKSENIIIPEKGKLFAPGGLRKDWTDEHKKFISDLEEQGYKIRYSGAFVSDFNAMLKNGGIFTYPALINKPQGKLRLLMELQPLAFIVEQAGGMATNGLENILDIIPKKLDQRSPIYIGSKHEVQLAKKYINGE